VNPSAVVGAEFNYGEKYVHYHLANGAIAKYPLTDDDQLRGDYGRNELHSTHPARAWIRAYLETDE